MQHLGRILVALCLFGAAASAQQALEVAGLPADAPLTLWASASPDALTLDGRMKPGWLTTQPKIGMNFVSEAPRLSTTRFVEWR